VKALSFVVYGDPRPQGSKRAIVNRHTGKPAVIESGGAPLRTWRADIMAAARSEIAKAGEWSAFAGPLYVDMLFYLRRPKRPKAALPITRPDVDKLARAVMDALGAAGVFNDDAQVTTLYVGKRYSEPPRLAVNVREEPSGGGA